MEVILTNVKLNFVPLQSLYKEQGEFGNKEKCFGHKIAKKVSLTYRRNVQLIWKNHPIYF